MSTPMSVVRPVIKYLVLTILAAGVGAFVVKAKLDIKQEALANKSSLAAHANLVELVSSRNNTIRFMGDRAQADLGIKTDVVRNSPRPQPLRLPGTLFFDPDRLVHVHSRFVGEAVSLGQIEDGGKVRPLRYGDHVKKGQLLATIWSKEIGEKKSELVDALARLAASRTLLEKIGNASKGLVPERQIIESRRELETDMIAATRIERTLRSWRLSDAEIDAVKREVKVVQEGKEAMDAEVSRRWAETEVRAAIDGVIVEKNFNVGDIIEPQDDLFKIADLTRLQVMVNVYEEDLGAVRALSTQNRKWKLDLKSDPADNAIEGTFEMIGTVIDPAQRTGVLIGWLDNPNGSLAVGQFLTATIELPSDPTLVAVPESSIIEEGDVTSIFVLTNSARHEFSRRNVDVVRRTSGTVLIRGNSTPSGDAKDGVTPLEGKLVVVSGVLGLGGELASLKSDAPSR